MNTKLTWSFNWPEKEGVYCFYGRRSQLVDKDLLWFVNVHKTKQGLAYTSNGHLLNKENGASGIWRTIKET